MRHPLPDARWALPPSRFFTPTRPRRLLCFGASSFPAPEQTFTYDIAAGLADRLGAEMRFAHYETADPREGSGEALRWLPYGMFAPTLEHPLRADREHFRATASARYASLLDRLAAQFGSHPDEVHQRPDFLAALTQARWAQAWGPDVIVSFFAHHGAFTAAVTAWQLGVPRVHFDYPDDVADNPFAPVTREMLRTADVICVLGREQRLAIRRDFDGALDHRTISQEEHPSWQIALAERVNDRLRDEPPASARSDLGPRAAFATARIAPPPPPGRPVPFVVVAAERTGSNLLVDMLTTHPDVTSAGELFNTRMVDEGRLDTQLPDGVDADEILRLRREDPAACHEALLAAAARQGCKAAGFKLLYYHMISDDRVVDRLLSLPDLRVIHLVRRDRVARYVSHVRAERTDLWWSASSDNEAQRRGRDDVEVDPRMLLWDMQFVEQLEDRTRATFAGVRGLEIAYEDLVADLEGAAARVLGLLGVAPRTLTPKSQKQGEGDARRRIVNWEALRNVFRGSRWSPLF